jgi:membrane protein required for colicin V production
MMTVVILAFCVIRGIFRGLIKEVSSIVGVLAGFYAAYTYYPQIAGFLKRWMEQAAYANIISFLVLFCLVFFIISIIGVIIKYVMNIAFMGWFDRICGAVFGCIKGLLIVSVLLMIFTTFLPRGTPFIQKSLLAPHVAVVSEKMARVVSKDMKHEFNEKIDHLKKTWKVKK